MAKPGPFPLRILAGAAFYLLLEAAVFRSGFYTPYLEPDSSAGLLDSYLRSERERPGSGPNQVLAIGHSRMGFRARHANQLATGYEFASIAMPGSTPRCWYYMLREVDPTRSRYAAILIGVDDYDDEDYEDLSSREMDIRYVTPLLGWRDVLEFPLSYPEWRLRWEAFRAAAFQGFALRADFQDFLVRHKERMKRIDWVRRESAALRYNAPWGTRNMAGLAMDWKAWKVASADGLTEVQRRVAVEVLLRETIPQTGQRGAYLRRWYGKVAELYRGSRTRIVFLRLPRGPVVRPALVKPLTAAAREMARAYPHVLLVPEHACDSLERGEYFGDAMHLNEPGSVEFSRLAAREVVRLLGEAGAR